MTIPHVRGVYTGWKVALSCLVICLRQALKDYFRDDPGIVYEASTETPKPQTLNPKRVAFTGSGGHKVEGLRSESEVKALDLGMSLSLVYPDKLAGGHKVIRYYHY